MDRELREYLDRRFRESSEQLQQFREETNGRFEGTDKRFDGLEGRLERVETGVRENRVLIEGLDGKVQLVAEGVANVDSKLERFKGEVAQEFKEVRATMDLHFSHLDRLLKKQETPTRSRKQSARAGSG